MTFSAEQVALLDAPLDSANVKQREQSGFKLDYIEAWHAIAEANRIFGHDAWARETVDIRCVSEKEAKVGRKQDDGFKVSYIAKVRVTVDGVLREGCGAGHGIDRDLGQAHESAIKEAESDAMKRALMTFGNPFGLALYDRSRANVSSASSLKKNGEWDRFYDKLTSFEQAKALADWMPKARAGMKDWPSTWVENAEEEFGKHMQFLMDKEAKVA